MLRTIVFLQVLGLDLTDRVLRALRRDDGQSTAEYALVLLGAVAVAALFAAWATRTDRITRLLNAVLDKVISQV